MGRISNRSLYPNDNQVSLDDFFIGTDRDNQDATRTYPLSGLLASFKSALNLTSIEYTFSDGTDPDLDQNDAGYFTTNSNETLAPAVTAININKLDLAGVDITSLLEVVGDQPTAFTLRITKPAVAGQVFYFSVTAITDNLDDTYTLTVENFIGSNSLVDGTTYGFVFDLSGVPSIYTETDPIFTASPAGGITTTNINNWNTAFGWGNHATAGYQAALSGTGIVKSTAGTISYITDNSANWNTAFGWGNHATAGYLTSYTETDPVFSASPAAGITVPNITQWNLAYSWGNHALAGYLTSETDPVFAASIAAGITLADTQNWDSAYSWGDHDGLYLPLTLVGTTTVTMATNQLNWSSTSGDIVMNSGRLGVKQQVFGASRLGDSEFQAANIDLQTLNFKDTGQQTAVSFFFTPVGGSDGYVVTSKNFVDDVHVWSINGVGAATYGGVGREVESTIGLRNDYTGGQFRVFDMFNQDYDAATEVAEAQGWVAIHGGGATAKEIGLWRYDTITYTPIFEVSPSNVWNFGIPDVQIQGNQILTTASTAGNYVLKAGDTMTGNLIVDRGTTYGVVGVRREVSLVDYESVLAINGDNGGAIWGWTNGAGTNTYLEQGPGSLLRFYDGTTNQTVYHSGNFTPGNYVLKAGDSMTGTLTFNSGSNIGLLTGANSQRLLLGGGSAWSGTAGAYFQIEGLDFGGVGAGGDIIASLPSNKSFIVNGLTTLNGATTVTNNIVSDRGTTYGAISQRRTVSTLDYESYLAINGGNGAAIWGWVNGGGTNTFLEQNGTLRYYNGTGYIWTLDSTGAVTQDRGITVTGTSQSQITTLNGFINAKQSGQAYRAILGTSSTANNFLVGGSTIDSSNVLDTYLRIRTIAAGDLHFQESGNAWKVWHEGNDGSGSGLDADRLDGKQLASTGDRWDVVPFVAADGVMEIGRYIDFHLTDVSVGDNDGRFTLESAGELRWSNILNATTLRAGTPSSVDGNKYLEKADGGSMWTTWEDNYYRYRRGGTGTISGWRWDSFDTPIMTLTTAGNLTARKFIVENLAGGYIQSNGISTRDKIRVWNSNFYTIGMETSYTFGALGNDFAMTFQMNNSSTRGFWWGDSGHTNAQGAMALTTDGRLTVANYMRLGYGETDTTSPGTTYRLQVNGSIQASNFVLSSDRRLKENIRDYQPEHLPIRWRVFDRKEGGKGELGVIAQEVQEIAPQFVVEDEQGLLSVKETQLLIAKNAELEARIERLELIIKTMLE